MVSSVANIANTFAGIPTTLINAFGTVLTWLEGAWDGTVNYIAKKLLYLYSLFDKSVDYEATAKQMDKDAAGRANARQRSLDDATGRRNEDLQRANAGRLEMANGITANIRAEADRTIAGRNAAAEGRKSEFDARVNALSEEIQTLSESIADEAIKLGETTPPKPSPTVLQMPSLGMMSDAATTAKPQGTFSGFGAALLGTGTSAIDKLASESKKQTTILGAIADNTANAGGTDLGE
jgi:hypothetical protein